MSIVKKFLKQDRKNLNNRFIFIYLLVTLLFGSILVHLINLQVVRGNENLFLSSTIKTSEVTIRAPRGLIYDRDGNLLVVNRPSFQLLIDLSLLKREDEERVIKLLAQTLEADVDYLWEDFVRKVYVEDNLRMSISHIVLLNDVERDKIVSIYSRSEEFPGVYVEVSTSREYKYDKLPAHVIGYIQGVSSSDLGSGNYSIGDVIGVTGLERQYDTILRGINGRRIIESDRDDITVRELIPMQAIAGQNLKISMDIEIQEKLTEALQSGIDRNNAMGGVAIIQDIHNGEILAMVSLPSYDPNKIVKGLTFAEYQSLSEDPTLPLYNRAISMNQPPGSTFKTIVASVALEEGIITTDTVFESTGCMDLGGGFEFCEAGKRELGKLDFYHGISRSSNIYFCNTMLRLGIDTLGEYLDDFGLGQNTGIDLGGEQGGSVASRELKEKLVGEPWYDGDSCNTAIGQGIMKVSPIQMVGWTSSIANEGSYYKPHLGIAILDGEGREIEVFEPEIIYELPISDDNLEAVREGMHLAVNDSWGSAFPLRGLYSDVAAKTGSAEAFRKVNGEYEKQGHSWITGFFPYEEPKYAFVVYLEFGGWGYRSAEVMKDFLTWYESRYSL